MMVVLWSLCTKVDLVTFCPKTFVPSKCQLLLLSVLFTIDMPPWWIFLLFAEIMLYPLDFVVCLSFSLVSVSMQMSMLHPLSWLQANSKPLPFLSTMFSVPTDIVLLPVSFVPIPLQSPFPLFSNAPPLFFEFALIDLINTIVLILTSWLKISL